MTDSRRTSDFEELPPATVPPEQAWGAGDPEIWIGREGTRPGDEEDILVEVPDFTVEGLDDTNPKDLLGILKPDLSLVPPAAILHEAMAMMDGAKKYGPYNWRDKKVRAMVYLAAGMRHMQQLLDGENFDPKSKVHHAGHARACLGIYLDAMSTGNLIDDRPTKGAAGELIRQFEETGSFGADV